MSHDDEEECDDCSSSILQGFRVEFDRMKGFKGFHQKLTKNREEKKEIARKLNVCEPRKTYL